MKFLQFTEEHHKMMNELAHVALKAAGVEAYQIVKKMEVWLASAVEQNPEEKKDEFQAI